MEAMEFMFSEAKPEFAQLPETEVWHALNRNDDSPVAAEVTRLVVCFFGKFKGFVEANGFERNTEKIMHVFTRCPIERVAVLIMIFYSGSESASTFGATLH
jgi:hypothetical protein